MFAAGCKPGNIFCCKAFRRHSVQTLTDKNGALTRCAHHLAGCLVLLSSTHFDKFIVSLITCLLNIIANYRSINTTCCLPQGTSQTISHPLWLLISLPHTSNFFCRKRIWQLVFLLFRLPRRVRMTPLNQSLFIFYRCTKINIGQQDPPCTQLRSAYGYLFSVKTARLASIRTCLISKATKHGFWTNS